MKEERIQCFSESLREGFEGFDCECGSDSQ